MRVAPPHRTHPELSLKQDVCMKQLFLLAVAFGLSTLHATAATDGPSAHELHTAQCVAALEANTDDLASQIRAGNPALQPLLLDRLKYGAAFIGEAYLRGERDEGRAQALLKEALEAQKALPQLDLVARQSACAQEGERLFAKADILSRAVVSRLAQRRMKKLLDG
jgi:hypothetical protein